MFHSDDCIQFSHHRASQPETEKQTPFASTFHLQASGRKRTQWQTDTDPARTTAVSGNPDEEAASQLGLFQIFQFF